jgi:hypothetical protein
MGIAREVVAARAAVTKAASELGQQRLERVAWSLLGVPAVSFAECHPLAVSFAECHPSWLGSR